MVWNIREGGREGGRGRMYLYPQLKLALPCLARQEIASLAPRYYTSACELNTQSR